VIYAVDKPQVLAVLDWELSTLGDPISDLAYCCMMYHLPGDKPHLKGMTSHINMYCSRSRYDVSDLTLCASSFRPSIEHSYFNGKGSIPEEVRRVTKCRLNVTVLPSCQYKKGHAESALHDAPLVLSGQGEAFPCSFPC
jgi:hypothetical protein